MSDDGLHDLLLHLSPHGAAQAPHRLGPRQPREIAAELLRCGHASRDEWAEVIHILSMYPRSKYGRTFSVWMRSARERASTSGVEDPSAFTDLLGNFVMAAVAFRDGQMFGTVDGERVPVMTIRKLAEEPGVFADAFQIAEAAIATATKYGLSVEADDGDDDAGQEIADEIADAFE